MPDRLVIPLLYDFASTLCYVTHRVMERIAPQFEERAISFDWQPLDLAGLLNWKRGGTVAGPRLANVERVMRELSVEARVPNIWLDSRSVNAAAIALESDDATAATWRERVFTAIFEEGRTCDDDAEPGRWARDVGIALADVDLEAARAELEGRTRQAARDMVTGVPTFMLAQWPMGGIQDDDTMVRLITRFAERQRGER